MFKDWNYQRYRTRDLLSQYSFLTSSNIYNEQILPTIYPWENSSFSTNSLKNKIYQIFKDDGYNSTQENFYEKITKLLQNDLIVADSKQNFPIMGDYNSLYLDRETGIVYYFTTNINEQTLNLLAIVDQTIVGTSTLGDQTITYAYIPIKALLIQNN